MAKAKLVKIWNENFNSFLKEMISRKETFTVSYTSYTTMLHLPRHNVNYFFLKESNKEAQKLCSKIKSEVKKSNIHVDNVRSGHVKYFRANNLKDCNYKKVYNVDITDCYPSTLQKMGFITEKLYLEMKEIDKITKLKAIGQIATRKTIYEYTNGICDSLRIKEDELLRNIWFTICHECGEAIYQCQINIKSFLFFWFDGIYFKDKKEVDIITKILDARGYKYKVEILSNFKVINTKEHLRINYDKKDGQKTFCLPLSEKISYN